MLFVAVDSVFVCLFYSGVVGGWCGGMFHCILFCFWLLLLSLLTYHLSKEMFSLSPSLDFPFIFASPLTHVFVVAALTKPSFYSCNSTSNFIFSYNGNGYWRNFKNISLQNKYVEFFLIFDTFILNDYSNYDHYGRCQFFKLRDFKPLKIRH